MRSNSISLIKSLLKRPSFTTADAFDRGVSSSLLSYYAHKGYIEKISRGVYRGLESKRNEVPFEWEDLIATVQSIRDGRACLISALAVYDLTDEVPRQFWIAVPHKMFAPKRPKTRIVRMRDMGTGAELLKLGSVKIRVFNKERTIVDAFRFLSPEIAIKALKRYLSGKRGKPNLVKLRKYSIKLNMPIHTYVEALTT